MVLLEHFQAADSTKTAAVRTSQLREVVRGIGFDVSDELAKYIGSRYSFIMMPY
jgi:Ca2+-binding EF-hand superfamily protein